ncbi:MAG: glycosyltransferase [Candidatus Eiseniibacteriota bacterium]
MKVGVVVSCYRQERFLARTVAAIEAALAGEDWQGILELAVTSGEPLPALSDRWRVLSAFDPVTRRPGRPLTPGAGRMLGLSACPGDWVLFADSDVEVEAAWVRSAIALAAREPDLAAVFGRIDEWFVDGAAERPGKPDMYRTGGTDRPVNYLAALAFYRRSALLAAGGYDERLNSDEDFELGLRLGHRGLAMRSLGMLAARHWSAPRPTLRELVRRWQTGICFGQGQVLRLYLGRRGFGTLLRRQWLFVGALGMWTLGLGASIAALAGEPLLLRLWAPLPLATLALMSLKKRSLRLGALSLLTWTVQGLGLVVGLFRLPLGARPLAPAAKARC